MVRALFAHSFSSFFFPGGGEGGFREKGGGERREWRGMAGNGWNMGIWGYGG